MARVGSGSGSEGAAKYPPSEFSQKYARVLAPNGKLVSPADVFGESGVFDKDVEEKTRLAFKVTMKKLDKLNAASDCNKEHLAREKIDQVVECFPNTLPKDLPDALAKIKWSKKAVEVEGWDIWWEIHEKILKSLRKQATHIQSWWEYTGRAYPGDDEILGSLKRLVSGVLTHPLTIGKVIVNYTPKRKKDKPKSIHLVGTDRPEATMIYSGFFTEILMANPLNPIKITLVSPDPANRQLAQDCSPSSPMLIHQRCKLTAWDGLYHDFWERYIQTRKVEKPDVVMGIHPGLHAEGVFEFWEPTLDLLLEENIKTIFTVFNKEEYECTLERLDSLFVKFIYKGINPFASCHVKQTPHDPNLVWASNQYLIVFQGRTVDMKTLTLIEEPAAEENLDEAEEEFERLLRESNDS